MLVYHDLRSCRRARNTGVLPNVFVRAEQRDHETGSDDPATEASHRDRSGHQVISGLRAPPALLRRLYEHALFKLYRGNPEKQGVPAMIALGKLRVDRIAQSGRSWPCSRPDTHSSREKGTIMSRLSIASGPLPVVFDDDDWGVQSRRSISNVNIGTQGTHVAKVGVRYDRAAETCGVSRRAPAPDRGAHFAGAPRMPSVRSFIGVAAIAIATSAAGCHRDDSEAGVIKHDLLWHQEPNT